MGSLRIPTHPVAAAASAKTALLVWGLYASGTGYFFDAWARRAGNSNATESEETWCVAPFAGTITQVTLCLSTANTNQVFSLYKNGSSALTVSPTSTASLHSKILDVSLSVAKDDELSVILTSGTASIESGFEALLVEG